MRRVNNFGKRTSEVKNCYPMRPSGLAEFPDCVATRSLKHLRELTARAEAAGRGVEVLAYACEISPAAVRLAGRRPWTGAGN